MTVSRLLLLVPVLTLAAGCGGVEQVAQASGETGATDSTTDAHASGSTSDDASSNTGTDDGDGGTTGTGDGGTTGTGDGGTTGTGDGGTAGTGDGDGDPLACTPPDPDEIVARFEVTPSVPIEASCTLVSQGTSTPFDYQMLLDCDGTEVEIAVTSTLTYPPSPWGAVRVDYRMDGEQRWLAVHDEGPAALLLLGAIAAETLDPPGATLVEFFGNGPIPGVADEQPCLAQPAPCGNTQRLALTVDASGIPTMHVFDQESWLINLLAYGHGMEVERAVAQTEPGACPADPPARFDLVYAWYSDH